MPASFHTLTSNSSYKHKYPALLALYPFTVRLLLLPNSSISGSDQPNNIASWFTGRSTRKKLGGLGRATVRKEREVVITWNVNLECTNRSFSHDVTAAIFVYKTMNRRPCLCTKKILWELNSFHMFRLPFIPSNLQSCWPRDWKRSMGHLQRAIQVLQSRHAREQKPHSDEKNRGNFHLTYVSLVFLVPVRQYHYMWSFIFLQAIFKEVFYH